MIVDTMAWLARGNVCGNGHPSSGKWRQLKCIVCETYFIETQGTIFYRIKASLNTIISALKALAEGLSIQSTACVFDVDADTAFWLSDFLIISITASRYYSIIQPSDRSELSQRFAADEFSALRREQKYIYYDPKLSLSSFQKQNKE